jgi:hypothetical protein
LSFDIVEVAFLIAVLVIETSTACRVNDFFAGVSMSCKLVQPIITAVVVVLGREFASDSGAGPSVQRRVDESNPRGVHDEVVEQEVLAVESPTRARLT